jgi:hypothetical protein
MYQQLSNNPMTGAEAQCIKRLADNAFIPFDPANTDYQEYLKWLARVIHQSLLTRSDEWNAP